MIPVLILGSPSTEVLQFFNRDEFQVYVLENIRDPRQIPDSLLPTEKKYLVVPANTQPLTSSSTIIQIVQNLPSKYPLVILSGETPGQLIDQIPQTQFQIRTAGRPLTTQDVYLRQGGSVKSPTVLTPSVFVSSQQQGTFNWEALFILILVGFLMLALTIFMVKSQSKCSTSSETSLPRKRVLTPEE